MPEIFHPNAPPTKKQTAALSTAFLLTGAATAMLGTTLPIMLIQWHLGDNTGGSLLLLAWGGSTCGALLFRGDLRRAASAGLLLTALAMLALAAINRSAALPLFVIYGLGLGIAMTAITLLSSQAAASEPSRRAIMMRLNLLWSIGACISPSLTTRALAHTRIVGLFTAMGLVFCAAALSVLFSGKMRQITVPVDTGAHLRTAPFSLYALSFLAVGVESAIGGWLTTYAGRTAHTEFVTLSATSAFWVGLLLSRALHSLPNPRWLHHASTLFAHAAVTLAATATLLFAPHGDAFLPSALLAGIGLGPLYPRVLAMVVGTYKPRAIFIVAGVGSAALPWLTGTVSHAAGSLGSGLLVPCAGAAMLLALLVPKPAKSRENPPSA